MHVTQAASYHKGKSELYIEAVGYSLGLGEGEQPWQKGKALQNILDIKGKELKQKEMCIK